MNFMKVQFTTFHYKSKSALRTGDRIGLDWVLRVNLVNMELTYYEPG